MAIKNTTLRELNQRSGQIIAEVSQTGEAVVVTDRGRPVARIIPEPVANDVWERLVRDGDVVVASTVFRVPAGQKPESGRSSEEMLDELRRDR